MYIYATFEHALQTFENVSPKIEASKNFNPVLEDHFKDEQIFKYQKQCVTVICIA